MKNIVIIGAIVVLVLAFFISKKITPGREQPVNEEVVVSPSEEVVVENKGVSETTTTEKPVVDSKYSYTSSEFKFAVDLPSLVATRKTDIPEYITATFTFGAGDQSTIEEEKRIPNSMALYIWNDNAEFKKMTAEATELPDEKINGTNFEVYSFSNEGETIYHYTVEVGNKIYDIGVREKQIMNKFYMLK